MTHFHISLSVSLVWNCIPSKSDNVGCFIFKNKFKDLGGISCKLISSKYDARTVDSIKS